MPVPALKKLAKEYNITLDQAETSWDEAKKKVSSQYPEIDKDSDQYWALVTTISKKIIKGISKQHAAENLKTW